MPIRREDNSSGEDSLIYRLWNRARKTDMRENKPSEEETSEQALFVEPAAQEAPEQRADEYAAAMKTEPTMKSDRTAGTDGPVDTAGNPLQVEDARVEITVTRDKMSATTRVFPPKNGGEPVTLDQLKQAAKDAGVVFGIRETVFKMIDNAKIYDRPFVFAHGTAPIDGEKGWIEDLFSRDHVISPHLNEDGSVDFKDLNLVRIVRKNDPICVLHLPTEPVDGCNVMGEAVHGRPGKMPSVPKGKNTVLSQDEGQLLAACDGNLCFDKEQFLVEDVLHIGGNVDNGSGNIEFCGDVVIDGTVVGGFVVKSEKNITVHGHVEGASLEAEGDIILNKGMNGMGKGILKAGRNIRSRFLENCTLFAREGIYAETLMNCTASAEDRIVLEGRRGIMVGGTYSALCLIQAKSIGGESNVATTVVVGASPELLQEQRELLKSVKMLQEDLESLTKDVAYLDRKSKVERLNDRQKELYRQKAKQKMVALMEAGKAQKRLDQIEEVIQGADHCRLQCGTIYPQVKIVMHNETLTIQTVEHKRLFYWNEGEICRGQST